VNVIISGRHTSVSDAMKTYAEEKIGKLERYNDMVHEMEVILNIEGGRHMAEMIAHAKAGGNRIVGKAEHTDMYAAIDLLVEKMERQLKTHKEKVKVERKHSGRVRAGAVEPAPAPGTGEPDYSDENET
jgi:putative sigma-54 modulation protein